VESCLSYLTEVSEEAYRTLMPKYGDVFQQIPERLDSDLDDVVDDEERDRQEKKHYLFKIYQQHERHLKELPVVGFNSGKYDVNTMKVDIFAELVKSQKIKNTVKRNNNFMCMCWKPSTRCTCTTRTRTWTSLKTVSAFPDSS
jgi:hypothetical protein